MKYPLEQCSGCVHRNVCKYQSAFINTVRKGKLPLVLSTAECKEYKPAEDPVNEECYDAIHSLYKAPLPLPQHLNFLPMNWKSGPPISNYVETTMSDYVKAKEQAVNDYLKGKMGENPTTYADLPDDTDPFITIYKHIFNYYEYGFKVKAIRIRRSTAVYMYRYFRKHLAETDNLIEFDEGMDTPIKGLVSPAGFIPIEIDDDIPYRKYSLSIDIGNI